MANISTDNPEHAVRQQHSNHNPAQKTARKTRFRFLDGSLSPCAESKNIYSNKGKQIARRIVEQKYLAPQTNATASENRKQPQTLHIILHRTAAAVLPIGFNVHGQEYEDLDFDTNGAP